VIALVVDISLSPAWVEIFAKHGWSAVHWSVVGDPRAKDRDVMAWARARGHVVFTHDLDFGALLAATRANGPSVVQVRTHDVLPEHLETVVVSTIRAYEAQLERGAIVTVEYARRKVRLLPIGPNHGRNPV
jgi:predicted nuclease of predicted toxin-antitoxin system